MYDSPKAAHFDAYLNGKLLPDNNRIGLHARWEAAGIVAGRLGILSMIGLSDEDENRIDDRLETLFVCTGISVRRREHGKVMEASGEAEHADGRGRYTAG